MSYLGMPLFTTQCAPNIKRRNILKRIIYRAYGRRMPCVYSCSRFYVAAVDPLSSNVAEMSGVCHAFIAILRAAMDGLITQDVLIVVDSRIAMYKVVNAAAQVESKSRLTAALLSIGPTGSPQETRNGVEVDSN
eukprot:COSAG02_NODE_179_length_31090_cov_49.813785_8_plen_134_part_00